ncbi:MAG: CDP-alcohol phosphatidyltransferase family protein [Candidatus Obscuribacterales bacterium]|nr:CDP-alcohol phosphatidyltransferase family protein [Candidatus Obscuribacterales bacterium]
MNGIYAIKPKFQELLKPLEAALISAKVKPDSVTFSALGLSVAGGIALAFAGREGMLFLLCSTPLVTLLRTILNALDGMLAKSTGQARPFGEVINEFSDRLADLALFIGLFCSKLSNGPLLLASLISILLSSYLGILSKAAGGARQYGGLMGKADRMILLGLACPLAFFLSSFGICSAGLILDAFALVVLVGSLITIWQRAKMTYADLESNRQ